MMRFVPRVAPRRPEGKKTQVWQTIYIDLMTIIMVFFVILWSISTRKTQGIDDKIGEQTVRMVTLPGDVLFPSGKWNLSESGRKVFSRLFERRPESVLNFDTGGLVRRRLMIHGHTDSDGDKDENLLLGYQRAHSVYKEILKYGKALADHVILCTHADNSAAQEVPAFVGNLTDAQRSVVREAKARNRRITIEDKLVNVLQNQADEAR